MKEIDQEIFKKENGFKAIVVNIFDLERGLGQIDDCKSISCNNTEREKEKEKEKENEKEKEKEKEEEKEKEREEKLKGDEVGSIQIEDMEEEEEEEEEEIEQGDDECDTYDRERSNISEGRNKSSNDLIVNNNNEKQKNLSNLENPNSDKNGFHECKVCFRVFRRFEHLKRHTRTHTGEKPFTCHYESCRKKFSRKDNMDQHLKSHALKLLKKQAAAEGKVKPKPTKSTKITSKDVSQIQTQSTITQIGDLPTSSASKLKTTDNSIPDLNNQYDVVQALNNLKHGQKSFSNTEERKEKEKGKEKKKEKEKEKEKGLKRKSEDNPLLKKKLKSQDIVNINSKPTPTQIKTPKKNVKNPEDREKEGNSQVLEKSVKKINNKNQIETETETEREKGFVKEEEIEIESEKTARVSVPIPIRPSPIHQNGIVYFLQTAVVPSHLKFDLPDSYFKQNNEEEEEGEGGEGGRRRRNDNDRNFKDEVHSEESYSDPLLLPFPKVSILSIPSDSYYFQQFKL